MTFISRYLIYNKRARLWAILWTLLIFFLCFLPGDELPEVDIPFIDKWTHIILFAVFSFLWLCAGTTRHIRYMAAILIVSIYLGWLVEYVQGHYIPRRSQDVMDTIADVCGAFAGVIIFLILHKRQPLS
jgi:VanZ family protein